MTEPLARLSGVVHRFGRVTALAGASLELRAGEIHGVLGENGAGKTTLLNVLGGMLRPDAGTVEVDGTAVSLSGPRDAWALGVGMVHQHFTLIPPLTVLENLALGGRSAAGGWKLPYGRIRDEAGAIVRRTGLAVPLDAPVEDLGVGDRQRVEILKALLREPRILVLDEPTAVLTPREVETLFELLRDLAAEGRAVALVAHKLDEVLAVADRVSVLRGGRTVLTAARADVDAEGLIRAMVGRDVDDAAAVGYHVEPSATVRDAGEQVARLSDVRLSGPGGARALDGVSLHVRRGEIVGVTGVEGNGQHELALVMAERLRPDSGEVSVPPGLGFIPQDRTTEGVIRSFDLAENVALSFRQAVGARRGGVLDWNAIRARTEEIRTRYDVRAPSVEVLAGTLSGGNQQRLVVGRELAIARDLLVAENPTRGLDVSATSFVHEEIRRISAGGATAPGIILISTDLDEVLALSDRVFAMVRGRLVPVPGKRPTREAVGAVMLSGGGSGA